MPPIFSSVFKRLLHAVHGLEEQAETLEGEVLALERDDDEIRRNEAVESEQAEGRRAVDEDVVEPVCQGREGTLEEVLPVVFVHQLHGGTGEIDAGRNDREIGNGALLDGGVWRDLAHDELVDSRLILLRAYRAGGIALGIEIHQEHLLAGFRKIGSEVDRRRRLADSSLLIRENDDLPHSKRNTAFPPC